MDLCEELLMRDVGWRRRRRTTSFWQKAASSPCVRYNTQLLRRARTLLLSFFISGSRPTLLSLPSSRNFMIAQYQFFPVAFSGTPPIFKMFELSTNVVIALAIRSHHGVSPSSTPKERVLMVDRQRSCVT